VSVTTHACKQLLRLPTRSASELRKTGPCGYFGAILLTGACDANHSTANYGLAMKLLQIVPRDGTHRYGEMNRKQAEIRRSGRGAFSRTRVRMRNAASNI
jgi:hypothetical protein